MNEKKQAESIEKYVRLTDYLSVSQIFLRDNFFVKKELKFNHIKKRLLGHWGTCPGINFVYANLNNLIINHNQDILLTVGVGHGFPAYQANIFLEKTLTKFFPEKNTYDQQGVEEVIENFSTPYGYPSHLSPEAPGTILEGGELGYSLAVAAGTILDHKKLINAVIIGDGEAETGPLAASWNVNKLINPKHDGAVLPILHLNGYKISGPTVFGRMTDENITKYFEALGWEPFFIDESKGEFYKQGVETFEEVYQKIKKIKKTTNPILEKIRWPLIVLKTPKGLGVVKEIDERKIEGNHYAHQVVFDNLKDSREELKQLENWLKSYQVEKLIKFDNSGKIILDQGVESLIPKINKTIGSNKYGYGEQIMKKLPIPQKVDALESETAMHLAGKYFKDLMDQTKADRNFRIFSPDETYSNKLTEVFKSTSRVWAMPVKEWDLDMSQNKANDGRVVELLSEHVLFGMLWGYTVSGRQGVFVSYEAFAQIVASMADQYVKFLRMSQGLSFRKKIPALNVILSSLLERQDHNGFSHQNPSFISSNLDQDNKFTNVYFPADKNIMLCVLEEILKSTNKLNIVVAGKKMKRDYKKWGLKNKEIKELVRNSLGIWNFASDNSGKNPDLVVVTCGDYVTEEALAGVKLFKEKLPEIKLRFVNVFKLDIFNEQNNETSNSEIIKQYLTKDKGIVFNYHGYPATIKKLLFEYNLSDRIIINGYEEQGSTTSPFDMKARNGLSRFHLVQDLATLAYRQKIISKKKKDNACAEMDNLLKWEKSYLKKYKVDPEEIKNWEW